MKLHSFRYTIDDRELSTAAGDITLFETGRANGDLNVGNFRSNFSQMSPDELEVVALIVGRLAGSIREESKRFSAP